MWSEEQAWGHIIVILCISLRSVAPWAQCGHAAVKPFAEPRVVWVAPEDQTVVCQWHRISGLDSVAKISNIKAILLWNSINEERDANNGPQL